MSVTQHQRAVGRAEALRILGVLGAVVKKTSGNTTTYWSTKVGWITITKTGPEMFKIWWSGPRDCGC